MPSLGGPRGPARPRGELRRRQRGQPAHRDDGRLGPAIGFVQHTGAGADPKRQKGPHAHMIDSDPSGRLVLAADLGLDKVLLYRLDAKTGALDSRRSAAPEHGARRGAAPLRLLAGRAGSLRLQRDPHDDHALSESRAGASPKARRFRRCLPARRPVKATAAPRSSCIRAAGSSTRRTAASISSRCSPATPATGRLTLVEHVPVRREVPAELRDRPQRPLAHRRASALRVGAGGGVPRRPGERNASPDRADARSSALPCPSLSSRRVSSG